ncbi:hypothetical protein BC834DRAFT_846061 [Gloeopeniophorella convolvens]|nr:hypothetical protein BC834DRAFT_846061 [Gloeopeniophorella convolvens]
MSANRRDSFDHQLKHWTLSKFHSCIDSVRGGGPEKGYLHTVSVTTVLIPLTNSLYIIVDDVETGYYAKVVKHYEQKIDFMIKSNLDTLQETIQKKQGNMNYSVTVI